MAEAIVSVRVDEHVHEQMKLHEEINWSAIIRQSLFEKLEQLEQIDYGRARRAGQKMDKLRKAGLFSKGRPAGELIREWRDKRK